MPHAFARIAFTSAVRAAQERDGSRAGYARNFEEDDEVTHQVLGDRESEYLSAARSFYLATVSETGWPYLQHRGGPRGFLKVLDEHTLAFADFRGNRQMVSVGNAAGNDRVALIVMDYARRSRLKILGRLAVRDLEEADPLFPVLVDPDYPAHPQRAMVITVEGFDWNCPQHIPVRIDAEDVGKALAERDARIAELEARVREPGSLPA